MPRALCHRVTTTTTERTITQKIQEEVAEKRIQRNRSRHNDHQIDLLSPGKAFRPVVMKKAMTPDELRPSYVDPTSVPGLLDAPAHDGPPSSPPSAPVPARQVPRGAAESRPRSNKQEQQQQRKKADYGSDVRRRQIQVHERRHRQDADKSKHGPSGGRRAGGAESSAARRRADDTRNRDHKKKNPASVSHTKRNEGGREHPCSDAETSEVESDYTSSNSDDEAGAGFHTPRHKANRLRTVAEEPDAFSDDDSSIFDESNMPMKNSGIVEPDISFSEIERREEAAVAARAVAAAAAVAGKVGGPAAAMGGDAGLHQPLPPTDAILSPGVGRRFMGAMLELKAGPSQQQLERQHALRNQLKEDLEAQIEEKRRKDQKYRDEQRMRDEKEEAEARAYQERLDRLRAASPDTRARQKAREENDTDDAEKAVPFQIKEESIVGFSGRLPKSKPGAKVDAAVQNRGKGVVVHAVEDGVTGGDVDEDLQLANYGGEADVHGGAVAAGAGAAGPRVSFGHTAIRRDVAELRMQQQELVEQVQQLAHAAASAAAVPAAESESLERLKRELHEQQARAAEESERVRSQAKEEVRRIKAESEARLAGETVVRRSMQGASVLVSVDSEEEVFLVSEQLVPKETNYIPSADELREIRIDVDDLPSHRPVQSLSAASPSPDSALLEEREHEKRVSEGSGERKLSSALYGVVQSQSPMKLAAKPSRLPHPPQQQNTRPTPQQALDDKKKKKLFGRPGEKLQRTQRRVADGSARDASAKSRSTAGASGGPRQKTRRQWGA